MEIWSVMANIVESIFNSLVRAVRIVLINNSYSGVG